MLAVQSLILAGDCNISADAILTYIQRLTKVASPLATMDLANEFIDAGRIFGVDPRLVVAIAWHESHFGTDNTTCVARKNYLSWMPSGTCKQFTDLAREIDQVTGGLRVGPLSIDQNPTVEELSRHYCGRGPECKGWAPDVANRMRQLGGDPSNLRFACGFCGDNERQLTEQCDGNSLGQCERGCTINCRCSVCGNSVVEPGEECDGTTPHADCATMGCRPNCTIDCGTCMACLSDVCTDITPAVTDSRWAVVIQHAGGHVCTCSPPGNCTCGWGVALDMGYYPIFADAHPRPIGCCYKGSSGSSDQHFPSCGDLPPECDERYQLNLTWGEYQACKPMNCVQPGVGCIPPEEFDRFDEAPPLGTVFDLRSKAEKDSGCGTSPEGLAGMCIAPSCCP